MTTGAKSGSLGFRGFLCALVGFVSVALVFGASGYGPVWALLLVVGITLVLGTVMCEMFAEAHPESWFIFPMLFGIFMALFGFSAGYSPPNPRGEFMLRALAVTYAVIPTIGAYIGHRRGKHERQ